MRTLRHRFSTMVLAGALCAAAMVALRAQAPPQTPRDAAAPLPIAGTAAIVGTTVDSEARPVRRVSLTLTMTDTGRAVRAFTDDTGRFAFTHLPSTRYTLTANKPNYVTFNYGAKMATTLPGSVIVLKDGQQLDLGSIALVRTAVITGTAFGALGRPLGDTSVTALPVQMVGGAPKPTGLSRIGSATTDDRGVFRISGLPPGTYVVRLSPPAAGAQYHRVTDAEFSWATQPAGQARVPPPTSSVFAYVFYPDVVDVAGTIPITVGAGEERTGIDLHLQLVPTSRISGVVVGPDGQPMAGLPVRSMSSGPATASPFAIIVDTVQAMTRPDGTFVMTGVSPGQRTLMSAWLLSSSGAPITPAGEEIPAGATLVAAMQDVQVAGTDLSAVTLRLQPLPKIGGRIAFEPGTRPVPDNPKLFMGLSQQDRAGMGSMPAATRPDGTFTIDGVLPGRFRLSLQAPEGWFAKSAMYHGQDLLDSFVDLRPDGAELVVTFTDRMSEISGTLTDAAGQPAPQFYIEIFSADRTHWVSGSRRTKTVRAATDGKYRIGNLPAGDYYLCALTEYDPVTSSDPDFLEQLVAQSIRITVSDGEKKTQDLKLK